MSKNKHKTKNLIYLALFLMPSMSGFLLFYVYPFILGAYYSLINNPITKKFVGLKNYIELLENHVFLLAAKNTLLYILISVPAVMAFSLLIAILLSKKIFLNKLLQSIFIIPLVIPVASVVLLWEIVFDSKGYLNFLFNAINIKTVDWLNTSWARTIVFLLYLWKNTGYNMVLFLTGLRSIPQEYYEAAKIDGANRLQMFTHITFIYLTPTTFFVFIVSIINSFKVFKETYLLAGNYPHESIYMLQHYMNNVFGKLDYQKLTAAAIILFTAIYIIVLMLFGIQRKINRAIS